MSQMDRKIERRRGPGAGTVALVVAGAALVALVVVLVNRTGTSRLRIDPSRMTTAQVQIGEFREYYPFDGRVEPITSVYLDVEEGGRVEEIFVDGGQHIEKGELILRFSNATLRRNSIDTETRLVENLNSLSNTQFSRAQSTLVLRDQLNDLDFRILNAEKTYDRYRGLIESGSSLITREQFEQTEDELSYLRRKRELLVERIEAEDRLNEQQLEQASESIDRLNLALDLLNRTIEALDVRAPISGFLSNVDAQVGQTINRGQRIGQIDKLDAYKVRVSIDQFYISRVEVGTTGRFTLDGETHAVVVERVYPEVVNDAFSVDAAFVGAPPPGLRRGQRLTIEMSFSDPTRELMVAKGGFFQQTGGRYVYLIAEDRLSALRTPIRLGRQNPRFVEVLEGLREGDWIVTSGYDTFNEADELRFTKEIELID